MFFLTPFPVVCSVHFSEIKPMESFSGDMEESTEDIAGRVFCHEVLHGQYGKEKASSY